MTDASVSAIIPCYRCTRTIKRAVESVTKQTLRPKELILVDDGSGDDTPNELLTLQNIYGRDWIRIILLDHNYGVSYTRNVAWDMATQEYVAFLDNDDIWHNEKIALQYLWMLNHPEIALCGHDYRIFTQGDRLPLLEADRRIPAHSLNLNKLLLSNPFTPSAVMLKRNIPFRFDVSKKYCEDYLLWLQLILEGYKMTLLESVLVYKYMGKNNPSRKIWQMRFGDLNNYWILWRTKKLNFFKMNALILYSSLKFFLMLLVGPEKHYVIKQSFLKSKILKKVKKRYRSKTLDPGKEKL